MLQEILEELAITADQALMIGDSEADYLMAQNVGVDSVLIGHCPSQTSAICVENLVALVAWLQR